MEGQAPFAHQAGGHGAPDVELWLPPLVMLCVLILPQSFAAKHGPMYSLLVDLPIFFATSVSIALFYLVGQMHQNPRGWWRDIWLMPFTLALATACR